MRIWWVLITICYFMVALFSCTLEWFLLCSYIMGGLIAFFFFSRKSFDLYFRIIQQLPSVGLFFIYFFIFLDVGFAVVISKYIKYTISRTCIYISFYIHSQQFHTRVYLKSLFREISVKKNYTWKISSYVIEKVQRYCDSLIAVHRLSQF